jgi:rod shape-determining protein MreD
MAERVFSLPALPRVPSGTGRLLPAATMIVAVLITVIPVRIPGYAALTPAFTLMAAYHWTIYRPDLLPASVLFGIGLAEDLVTGGPVGITALLLLIARAAVLNLRRYFVNRGFAFVWAGFTVLAVLGMLFLWVVHCALDLTILDFRSTLFRTVLTIASFPAASFLVGRAQRALIGPRPIGAR